MMTEDFSKDLRKRLDCFIKLLQILQVCCAYEIKEEKVNYLEYMIKVYLRTFHKLYPEDGVTKFHFMIHFPDQIRRFGPLRQQWSFRFEALHAYFKGLVSVVRNFKCMPLTLSDRHQARLCAQLANNS